MSFIVISIVLAGCTGGAITTSTSKGESSQEEVKTPDPITLTGSGQKATEKFTLTKGLAIFKMDHKGSSNWAPKLLDSQGNDVELLANEIGVFAGSKAVGIEGEGEYLLDVTASGNWTITIEQPRANSAPFDKTFNGKGQMTTSLFSLEEGLATFKMSHKGDSNWAPILLDKNGRHVELLANEIGIFDGSKAVRINESGIYLIDITANGTWTITIGQ